MTTNEQCIAVYDPSPWQTRAWRDKSFILLLTGSAGGGKSVYAGEKLHAFCKKYSGAMALAVRKTRNSMTNSTALFLDRTVIGNDPQVVHYPSKSRFEYTNGSILAYGGMANEDQREQIRSIGQAGSLDIVWMEEATGFTEDDFNELLARMRGKSAPWQQVMLSTNPAYPQHWINQRLIIGKEASVIYSSAKDNPYNSPSYQGILDRMTGVIGKRLRDGLWAQAEGAVYEEFSHEIHVRTRERDEFKRFIVGVDEGFTNPMVALTIGHDNDGRSHVIEEFYQTGVTHAAFVEVCGGINERFHPDAFYVDSAASGLIAAMQMAGLPAQKSDKSVSDGIQAVKRELAVAGDGKPRFTVEPDCTNTIGEFEAYVWAKTRDGQATDKPSKENDHAMDALRYAIKSDVTIKGPILIWA